MDRLRQHFLRGVSKTDLEETVRVLAVVEGNLAGEPPDEDTE